MALGHSQEFFFYRLFNGIYTLILYKKYLLMESRIITIRWKLIVDDFYYINQSISNIISKTKKIHETKKEFTGIIPLVSMAYHIQRIRTIYNFLSDLIHIIDETNQLII